jgi:hypothetical protein
MEMRLSILAWEQNLNLTRMKSVHYFIDSTVVLMIQSAWFFTFIVFWSYAGKTIRREPLDEVKPMPSRPEGDLTP